MAKQPATRFTFSTDPTERTGELIEAQALITKMINDALIEATKQGHGPSAIAAATGQPVSNIRRALRRLELLPSQTTEKKSAVKAGAKAVDKKTTKRTTKPAKATATKPAAKKATRAKKAA